MMMSSNNNNKKKNNNNKKKCFTTIRTVCSDAKTRKTWRKSWKN